MTTWAQSHAAVQRSLHIVPEGRSVRIPPDEEHGNKTSGASFLRLLSALKTPNWLSFTAESSGRPTFHGSLKNLIVRVSNSVNGGRFSQGSRVQQSRD
jgi:hypothetical protein